jgi:phosphinothricin acetyltransferase
MGNMAILHHEFLFEFCKMIIRPVAARDAARIAEIYNLFILNTIVTFEEEAVDAAEVSRRITEVTEKYPWLVAEVDGAVVGYAHASNWKSRCAFRNSVETTIYLHPEMVGKGQGEPLYRALLDDLRGLGLHAAIGGIALPNAASVRLHEKCGFRKIGEFVEVGFKFGKWINFGYWQLLFSVSGPE